METVRFYLAGGMTGMSAENQSGWRKRLCTAVKYEEYDCNKKAIFFDPTQHYSMFEQEHKSEREVMEFDLYNLRKSDIIIVNFNSPNSIGTAMELMLARELRKPVIGLNNDSINLHPWIAECVTRECSTFEELVEHIVEFYLN